MKRQALITALSLLLIFTTSSLYSQTDTTDPFIGLVDIVLSTNDEDSVSYEVPSYLADIISEYYADELVSDSVPSDVLSYVANVFSEHGYHDTGNWGKPFRSINYVPYKGKLPEYDPKDFQMPVKGTVTSGYGYRPKFGKFHRGIDMALNIGDTVVCALPGVVIITGNEPSGYGRYVVVSHAGGVETLYGHLNAGIVNPGQTLKGGDPIGIGGTTGNATGPHLHFETRYRGVAINPLTWLDEATLRR